MVKKALLGVIKMIYLCNLYSQNHILNAVNYRASMPNTDGTKTKINLLFSNSAEIPLIKIEVI